MHLAPEISKQVGSILRAAEGEAERVRQEAQETARRYVDQARVEAEGLVADRRRRLSELSDELAHKTELILSRLDDAAAARRGFQNLSEALASTADRLSREWGGAEAGPSAGEDESEPVAPRPPDPAEDEHPRSETAGAPDGSGREPIRATAPTSGPTQPRPFGATPQVHPEPSPLTPEDRSTGDRPAFDPARFMAAQLAAAGNSRSQVRGHLAEAMGVTDSRGILDEVFGDDSDDEARVPWAAWPGGDESS